jgi:nucleoside-diphosphate-sugar epimerase
VKRVLIVGAGYVGLPLATELARRGYGVTGLRRTTTADTAMRAAGITPLHADITRAESLASLPNRFDCVVNCTATGGGSEADYRGLYLDGTRNLLAWLSPTFCQNSDARFVYTSSTGVYGQNDGSLVDESSPTVPASETGRILVQTEHVLIAATAASGFPAVILRASGIYGPDRGYLLKQFLAGESRIEGDVGRYLNMIHRDDLIRAIIAALEHGRPGEIYNATDDEPVNQLTFYTWLAAKLGRSLPPTATASPDAARRRGLTSKRISNRKLRAELPCQFAYPTFREGYATEIARLGLG